MKNLNLPEIRELLIKIYLRNERYVIFLIKLIIGIFIFSMINNIGYAHPKLHILQALPVTLVLAAGFALMPPEAYYPVIILAVTAQLSSLPPFAVPVFLFLFCIYIFYIRLSRRESVLIIAIMVAYYFKVPYAVVLFAGLYMAPTSVIPIGIGTFLYYLSPKVYGFLAYAGEYSSITDLAKNFIEVYASLAAILSESPEWILVAFVHSMVFFVVFIVSKLKISYSKEVALLIGVGVNILGFVTAMLIAGIKFNFPGFLFFTLLSFIIVCIALFFDSVADYPRAYSVRFEDGENIYCVKVIPKALDGVYRSPNKFKR